MINHVKQLVLWIVTLSLVISLSFVSQPGRADRVENHTHFNREISVHDKLKIVKFGGWSVYDRPFNFRAKAVLNTNRLRGRLVKPVKKVTAGSRTDYLIAYRGRTYGWVDTRCLAKTDRYVLPYQYYSQLYPLWAPEACEATSLKIALSAKGLASDVGLKYIVDHMPESSDANRGFSGDPYRDNSGLFYWWNLIKHGFNGIAAQTIYPKPLARYARRYDPNARNITGATRTKLISEVEHGNPVVFVGAFQMIDTNRSYHILTLVGYRPGEFLVADPYRYLGQRHQVFWVRTGRFMKIFDNQLRGRRAVAL